MRAFLLPVFLALALLAASLLGYPAAQSLADRLAADGTLELYTSAVHAALAWALRAVALALFAFGLALRRGWHPPRPDWKTGAAPLLALLRFAADERRFALALLAVTLAGALGRALLLTQALGHDEAYSYIAFASRPLRYVLTDYHLPNNHVLHTALMFFSTRLFGDAPWALRLPAYLAGVALIPLAYLAGRAFYGRAAGLLAAAFTAALPVLVDFSVDARGYTLMAVFALLALLTAEAQRREPTVLGWLLLAVWFGLGLYTLPIMLLPMALLAGWWGLAWLAADVGGARRGRDLLGLAAAGLGGLALMLLLYSPIYIFGTSFDSVFFNRFVRPLPPDEFLPTLAIRLAQTRTMWTFDLWPLDLLLAGGFVLSMLFHWRSGRGRVPVQAGLLVMAAFMVARGLAPLPRNWVFFAPFVLLWAAAGWAALGGWALARRAVWGPRLLAVAVAAVALGGLAVSAATARQRLATPGLEERLAIYLLAMEDVPGRVLTTSPLRAPLTYYLGRRGGEAEDYLYTEGDLVDWALVVVNTQNETLASDAEKHGWAQWLDLPAAQLLYTTGPAEVWRVPTRAP
ncbi:MAG: hypothetical protein EPO32_12845 [Anaerolineae bacterium]|nr:MAG: hypothetical protein EPO32_12845 [Anaerolineae bacterium]